MLAKEKYGLRAQQLAPHEASFIPFTAQTRMSGIDFDGREVRKGAADAIAKYLNGNGRSAPRELDGIVAEISKAGGTPLVVAEDRVALGVINLKDVVKGGMAERFNQMRQMGIKTIMITGDNPLTAATIAREAGVDDFLAQATPEDKMALIKREQQGGKLVAMTFNALIIIALIPLALKGVKYRPMSAAGSLRRNLLIYGLGGIVVPFIGIKIIDVMVNLAGLV